jgi:general secretion pathway protein F
MTGRYRFHAVDARGQRQAGELAAASPQAALAQLQQRELTVLELGGVDLPAQTGRPPASGAASRKGIGAQDRMLLLQELATLLGAGISIAEAVPSLEAAYQGTPLGAPVTRLRQAVQAGRPVVDAFRAAALGLPAHIYSLVAAGEAAGRLGPALQSAADQLEYEHGVRQMLRNALVYPAVLVTAGAAAVLVIFIAVVPRFASLLGGRAEVPALSRWVIESGLFLKDHLLGVGLFLAALTGTMALGLRSPPVRQALLEAAARLPLVGTWLRTSETGRWATLLGTLLEHRVALLTALELSAQALSLQRLRTHLIEAQGEVRRGRALSAILAEQGWIAPTRLNLLRVGERAGELPRMLLQLGRLQTEAARQQMQRLLTLIEPLAILAIGSVIGVIMIGVVLAVTSLNTANL